jgi:hypothetical protein
MDPVLKSVSIYKMCMVTNILEFLISWIDTINKIHENWYSTDNNKFRVCGGIVEQWEFFLHDPVQSLCICQLKIGIKHNFFYFFFILSPFSISLTLK